MMASVQREELRIGPHSDPWIVTVPPVLSEVDMSTVDSNQAT